MSEQEKFATELRARRLAAGVSIYRVAKLAGLKWSTVQEIELGRRRPQRKTLDRIDLALEQATTTQE